QLWPPCRHSCPLLLRVFAGGEAKMDSNDGDHPGSGLEAKKLCQAALACARGGLRLFAVAVSVGMLAACTQHAGVTAKSAASSPRRYVPAESSRLASSMLHRRGRVEKKKTLAVGTTPARAGGRPRLC